MKPILYCHHESGHSYKVALALALMGIEYEQRAVDLKLPRARRSTHFQRASKFGEVPCLVLDGEALVQSNAILIALAECYGKLDGTTPELKRRVREWLFWEANRLAMSFPHLRYSRRFVPADPVLEGWWISRMQDDLERLDRALQGRAFLVGDAITIADVSCCGYLFWTDQAGVDLASWPALLAWLDRIRALPDWQPPYAMLDASFPIASGTLA